MVNLFRLLLGAVWGVFRARRDLLLENLALRQQLGAPVLGRMEAGSRFGQSRNGGPLAPSWIPLLLESDF
jgi:hypothetical protein